MLYTKWLLKVEGWEEDQKLLGEGQLRKSETKQGEKAGKQPFEAVAQDKNCWSNSMEAFIAPTGAVRHDDHEKSWHWTRSANRVMRKHVKMRGQSKWKNRFVVASLKSWWKKNEKWGFGGEEKLNFI